MRRKKQAEEREIFPCPRTGNGMNNILMLTFFDWSFHKSVMELVLSGERAYQAQQLDSRAGVLTHFQKHFHLLFGNFIHYTVYFGYIHHCPPPTPLSTIPPISIPTSYPLFFSIVVSSKDTGHWLKAPSQACPHLHWITSN